MSDKGRLKCPRCPKVTICVHHKQNDGLKECLIDNQLDQQNPDWSRIWPKFDVAEKLTDPSEMEACHSRLSQVDRGDAEVQDLARGLIMAAFAGEKIYQGTPLVKQLLEKAVEVFNFPTDFMKTVTAAGQAATKEKAAAKKATEAASRSQNSLSIQTRGTAGPNSATLKYAERPDFVDHPTSVFTNHFNVTITPGHVLYEYEIHGLQGIDPKPSAAKKKVLIERMIEQCSILSDNKDHFAYDNERKVISLKPLHDTTIQPGEKSIIDALTVEDYDRDTIGKATNRLLQLVYTREITFDSLNEYIQGEKSAYQETGAIEAMNILIARSVHEANNSTFQVRGNRYFTPTETFDFKKFGLIAIRGFYSSLRPGIRQLLLNVNTALSAFYKEQLVSDYIKLFADFTKSKKGPAHLLGLRVRIMYNRCKEGEKDRDMDSEKRRTKTITGFSDKSAAQTYFQNRDDKRVSVWDHFKDTYPEAAAGSTDKGNQICINTRGQKDGQQCWFLPDQLKVLPNQIYSSTLDTLDSKLPGEMITFACRPPEENRQAIIDDGLPALGLQDCKDPPAILGKAGIEVKTTMVTVPAKIIPSPIISYTEPKDEKKARWITPDDPKSGSWLTRNMGFLTRKYKPLGDIVFLASELRHPEFALTYIDAFRKAYHLNGINQVKVVSSSQPVVDFSLANLNKTLTSGIFANAGLLVLILRTQGKSDRENYSNFRIVTDQLMGKPSLTLCEERMLGSIKKYEEGQQITTQQLVPYVAANAMKINLRLGNTNHSVANQFSFLSQRNVCDTLILGADLIHPKSTSAEDTPSIAAVVGNVDDHYAKFLGSVRRQPSGAEYIDSKLMHTMALERIKAWQQTHNKSLPARILYYRDGVGNTQYDDIRQHEVAQIELAWENAGGLTGKGKSTALKMTTVIVTKRHNARFYPLADASVDRKEKTMTGNCMPGTVIDSDITSPYYFDFYLQSHDPLKGSAKPTYYFVLENGMGFNAAQLQNLTNALCYTFQHTTNAVSYVPAAYYADKLCERAALYLKPYFDGNDDVKKMGPDERSKAMDADWLRGKQSANGPWSAKFNNIMFWM